MTSARRRPRREASANLRRLAPPGTPVRLDREPRRPRRVRYGRELAYVHAPGMDLGRRQVLAGWARVYPAGHRYAVARTGRYLRAQDAARAADRGA